MPFPVRCFTCRKVIGNKWTDYKTRREKGESEYDLLKEFGIKRECCRRMFISHVDIDDIMLLYPNPGDSDEEIDEEILLSLKPSLPIIDKLEEEEDEYYDEENEIEIDD